MAQERYGFFDSSGEDIRSYSSVDMATAFHALASNGVSNTGTNLTVTAEGSTMRVLVGYGTAMIEGFYYQLRNDGGAVQAFTHTTEADLSRIDRIVLRLDLTARTISLVKLVGTAASTPEAPTLTRNEETYEISLAQVRIRAAAQVLLETDITDERENDEVCGLIAPEALRRTTIAQMIDDAIDQALQTEMTDVLRYSVQTLDAGKKTQARTNIDAQQKVTASGMLKGNGAGGVSAAAEGTDYAGISGGETHGWRSELGCQVLYNQSNSCSVFSWLSYADELYCQLNSHYSNECGGSIFPLIRRSKLSAGMLGM